MAPPPPPAQPPRYHPTEGRPERRSPRLMTGIAITALTLVALVGLVVLLTWLSIRPKGLNYTIEEAQVHGLNASQTHLNASFDLVFKAYNPNHRISVYYDSIEVSVLYSDQQTLAFDVVEPFYQPSRNVTRLESKPVARTVPLLSSVSRDLKYEKSSGEIGGLVVRVKARIRFKLGSWRSSHYVLRALCFPIVLHLDSSKAFERVGCDADI
ncbi:hypothetical protein Scep_015402 [Stephania cephalantha]|uniref:Late embryogenesis abundant protein LEA-2 subgroup domain-containing protein n=1 Tax=Stephania cephalantha TaxID=152367 RepID=A0AAP0J5L8_9MAGN